MNKKLSHINASGNVTMVDVSDKTVTSRSATATGTILFPEEVAKVLSDSGFMTKKGSIIQTAVIAGIQGVKKTADLIPLCHPLQMSKIAIDITPEDQHMNIICTVKNTGRTGVEMEALTGVSLAALTIYDMCKALSHDIRIVNIQLQEKKGGKSAFIR